MLDQNTVEAGFIRYEVIRLFEKTNCIYRLE